MRADCLVCVGAGVSSGSEEAEVNGGVFKHKGHSGSLVHLFI